MTRVLLLLVLLFAACGGEQIIAVTVTGRDAAARSLDVRVTSAELAKVTDVTQAASRFDLHVARPLRGALHIEVTGLDASGCGVQVGAVDVPVAGAGTYEVEIPLAAPRQLGCALEVRRAGPGQGSVTILAAEDAERLFTCPDLTMPCIFRPKQNRQKIQLRAVVAEGVLFTGWTSDVAGCNGLDCTFELGRFGARVTVGLRPAVSCGDEGLCWARPRPSGDNLGAVWARSPRDVVALGHAGSILRYNGQTWYPLDSGVRFILRDIYGPPTGALWVVGAAGTVLRIDGDAVQPQVVPEAADLDLHSVWGSGDGPAEELWIVGCTRDQTRGAVLRRSNGLFRRIDAGDLPCLSRVRGRRGAGGVEVFIIGNAGAAIAGYGESLVRLSSGTAAQLWGLQVTEREVFAVGEQATVLRFDGVAWSPMKTPSIIAGVAMYDLWGTGPVDLWAVGSRGLILHFDGAAWSQVAFDRQDSYVLGVHGSGRDDVWFVGNAGAVLRYDGLRLRQDASSSQETLFAAAPLGPGQALLTGRKGTILRWDGVFFQELLTFTAADLRAVAVVDAQTAYAVGSTGTILSWDGVVWSPASPDPLSFDYDKLVFTGIWAHTPEELWITGAPNRLYHYVPANDVPEAFPVGWAAGTDLYLDGIVGRGDSAWTFGRVLKNGVPVARPVLSLDRIANSLAVSLVATIADGAPNTIWMGTAGPWLAGSGSGDAGRVWRWDGAKFVGEATPGGAITALAGTGAEPEWAVGSGGLVLRRQNGAWRQVYSSAASVLNNVTVLPNGEVLMVGLGGQVLLRRP